MSIIHSFISGYYIPSAFLILLFLFYFNKIEASGRNGCIFAGFCTIIFFTTKLSLDSLILILWILYMLFYILFHVVKLLSDYVKDKGILKNIYSGDNKGIQIFVKVLFFILCFIVFKIGFEAIFECYKYIVRSLTILPNKKLR